MFFTLSVFLGIKVFSCFQRIWLAVPNIWSYILRCFLFVISFSLRLISFAERHSWAGIGTTFGLKIWFMYTDLLLKQLKVIELEYCSKQSVMGSQLIPSNWFTQIWVLLFQIRQKQINLFQSICRACIVKMRLYQYVTLKPLDGVG